MDQKIIYLFASSQRPRYQQDLINCISYPSDFIMHFRYNIDWISDEIIGKKSSELIGKEALIILVSEKNINNQWVVDQFYPLRKVVITDIKIIGKSLWVIYFKLTSEFVFYKKEEDNSYHKIINSNIEEKPISGIEELGGVFVSIDKKFDIKTNNMDITWYNLIDTLSKIENYRSVAFFKILKMYRITKDKEKDMDIVSFSNRTGYYLKSRENYVFELYFKCGELVSSLKKSELNGKGSAFISINIDDDFEITPNQIDLDFNEELLKVHVYCKKLVNQIKHFRTKVINKNTKNIQSANLEIPLKIRTTRIWYATLLLGVFFASGFFATLPLNLDWLKIFLSIFFSIIGTLLTSISIIKIKQIF